MLYESSWAFDFYKDASSERLDSDDSPLRCGQGAIIGF
jgi:hypothetical protein